MIAMVYNPTGLPQDLSVEARIGYETLAWLNWLDVRPFYRDIRLTRLGRVRPEGSIGKRRFG